MPEAKNTFLKAKMNKSLDDRLLPEGEYRDALNVQITKNDGNGSDVGVVHNVKGNSLAYASSLGLSSFNFIGSFFDEKENTIYWFVTNDDTDHRIYKLDLDQTTPTPEVIVSGSWLNFHSDNPIYGVNLVEDYLFWTDNRNQPRRIDVTLANNSYYNSDEKVSVVKIAPYLPPVIKEMTKETSILSRQIEEKFVRFSYRYKFTDKTYSLIAPFSAVAFKPLDNTINNNNNVSLDDETDIFKTSEVKGMVNGINQVKLGINVPLDSNIEQIDILYKESDSSAIRIIDTKKFSEVSPAGELEYIYKSTLPKSTLPERQLTRVFDNAPVKALAQEIIGNRVVYGNITLGYDIPDQICDYSVTYSTKENTVLLNQSIKQRRQYTVGIVFSDKFGRTSPVILSDESTIYVEPKGNTFDSTSFDGESLKIIFKPVSPGVAVKNAYDPITSPLGWYSYKIVIKQTQQEYYNVYTSGILKYGSSYIQLTNDNVNKVPRDSSNYSVENDKIASSNIRLFPRAVNEYDSNNNGGDFAKTILNGEDFVKVTSIGLATDLNLVTDTTSVINGMYNLTSNPLMAELSTDDLGAISSNFYPKIAIFETEPTESSLDIFYETPTCGLVSELNDNIDAFSLDYISFNSTDETINTVDLGESSRLNTVVSVLYGFSDNDGTAELIDSGVDFRFTNSDGSEDVTDDNFNIVYNTTENRYELQTKVGFAYDSVTPSNNNKTFYITGSYAGEELTQQFTVSIVNSIPTVTFSGTSTYITTTEPNSAQTPLANFTFTNGSLYGASGTTVSITSQEQYYSAGGLETNAEDVFGVYYDNTEGTGYLYMLNNGFLSDNSDGDYVIVKIKANDGTDDSLEAEFRFNLTESGVNSVDYYFASWSAFSTTDQACASSIYTSTWALATVYYLGDDEPMSLTNPSTPYGTNILNKSAKSGWYKSLGGTVGKWQSDGGSGGGWAVTPTSCPQ